MQLFGTSQYPLIHLAFTPLVLLHYPSETMVVNAPIAGPSAVKRPSSALEDECAPSWDTAPVSLISDDGAGQQD